MDLDGDRRLFDNAVETAGRILQANLSATDYQEKRTAEAVAAAVYASNPWLQNVTAANAVLTIRRLANAKPPHGREFLAKLRDADALDAAHLGTAGK